MFGERGFQGFFCQSIFPEISCLGTPVLVKPSEEERRLVAEYCLDVGSQSEVTA